MNVPVLTLIDLILQKLGSDSTLLGNGSIGLIGAPFSGSDSSTLGSITEAFYPGYVRQALGTSTVTFTGSDGNEYVEFSTLRFQPTGSSTVATIYGIFWSPGSDSTKLYVSDALPAPVFFAGPSNQLTVTPRFGLNPAGNFGINVISN